MKKFNLILIIGLFLLVPSLVNAAVLTTAQINSLYYNLTFANHMEINLTHDNSSVNNEGVNTNAILSTTNCAGGSKGCGYFGGSSKIIFKDVAAYNQQNNFTLSCWVNNSLGGVGAIGTFLGRLNGNNAGEWFFFFPNGAATLTYQRQPTGDVVSSASSPVGTWFKATVVVNDTPKSMQLYLNNTLVSTATFTDATIDTISPDDIYIGANQRNGEFYTGGIDECSIINKSITSDEVNYTWWQEKSGSYLLPISTTPPDTSPPTINISINNTSPLRNDVINVTARVTDATGLASCFLKNNVTNLNSATKTLSGTTDQCSFAFTLPYTLTTYNLTLNVTDTTANAYNGVNSTSVSVNPPSYTCPVGNATGWSWTPITISSMIKNGSATDWKWTTYSV